MKKILEAITLFGLLLPLPVLAADEPEAGQRFDATAFESTLHYQTGKVLLPNGKAELNLGSNFRYLSPQDTDRVLEEAWGNPKGEPTQGMIVPANVSPVMADGWGVIVEYEDSGHVSDTDAKEINYDDLLADMQKSTKEDNKEREKAGYESVGLVGWASKPYYDAAANRMYWAKELRFSKNDSNTLNYNIRVLGREGVLVLNAVAGMSQFAAIKPELEQVVQLAEFTPGHRYAEFNEKTDRMAEYGLAAMVAGGVAAKAGWLAPLLLGMKKGLVVILLGFAWLGKKIMSMLGRDKA